MSKCPFSFNAVTSYPDAAKAITTTTAAGKDGSTGTDTVIITNLTNPRSSDGMGLPAELSKKTIDMIVATSPAVAPKMLDITKCFYAKVLPKHPGLLQWFNPAVRKRRQEYIPSCFYISYCISISLLYITCYII
jgi:hypothetical protein